MVEYLNFFFAATLNLHMVLFVAPWGVGGGGGGVLGALDYAKRTMGRAGSCMIRCTRLHYEKCVMYLKLVKEIVWLPKGIAFRRM